ncbi:type II secretion system F family protein [Moraxella sp. Tifton1]|uniref:type II secretion system F family protein n=1 Tax=Moraxella oculi TaxID=2940516 RepID=UPI0020116C6C|nr:type II secretion system F family protein [Moraxella sp. Tifton1]MCL1623480.1 type II secretion system F family protein [Moraxella sp. Tifton1]
MPKTPPNTMNPKTFLYKGINLRGKKVVGEIDAGSIQIVRIKLHKQGINPISIRQKRTTLTWINTLKSIDITVFFRQLATMLLSGLPLTQALTITEHNSKSTALKTIISTIKTDIESGSTFTNAIKKHSVFSRLSIALIDAGERSGSLDIMLDRIASYQEELEILKNKLKKATLYPMTVLAVAIIVTTILLVKVVPIFAKTFADLGSTLPLPTRVIMVLSDALVAHFWAIFLTLIGVMMGIAYLHSTTDKIKQLVDKTVLKLPFINQLVKKSMLVRFSRTLATTAGAGVELLTAIELSAQATNHRAFIKELQSVGNKVRDGQKLSQAMSHSHLFLPMMVQMIAVGEESGQMVEMLNKIADYYGNEINEQIDGITNLIEPAIIVILGVVIGGVVLAMYLPIFEIGMNAP